MSTADQFAAHVDAQVLWDGPSPATNSIPEGELHGDIAWTRNTLKDSDGVIKLGDEVVAELDSLVADLRVNSLPIEALCTADFHLPHSRTMMAQAKKILEEGVGFVIIDKLPMERYSVDEARSVYWLLSQMVGRPVAQNWQGKLLYDVRDLGKPPGNGVRPDITNAEQNFHTDNSYNLCPPEYVSLLCVRPAKEGGVSSIVSFYSVFNALRQRHPQLISRLFQPYVFDRQREHAPEDLKLIAHPLVQVDKSRAVFRLSHRHVVTGYQMLGREMDDESASALETLESIMREPIFAREFFFEPGQIQIVDNKRCGHRRSGFVDHDEFERKRHLVRLWLRDEGRRFYNG
ncbi:TauD/TfdA family dioxygenase [Cupriavidus sp. 2SB]|uniref:TauD/TfdA family dioxygenase n=1 Tax=Cupriavidus sp. 2SB TaxID=2502199 RepID=UPI0010F9E156|nr:TauD/TfdA family dioxygenase [Cupriavidus sp. 2SB]